MYHATLIIKRSDRIFATYNIEQQSGELHVLFTFWEVFPPFRAILGEDVLREPIVLGECKPSACANKLRKRNAEY